MVTVSCPKCGPFMKITPGSSGRWIKRPVRCTKCGIAVTAEVPVGPDKVEKV